MNDASNRDRESVEKESPSRSGGDEDSKRRPVGEPDSKSEPRQGQASRRIQDDPNESIGSSHPSEPSRDEQKPSGGTGFLDDESDLEDERSR